MSISIENLPISERLGRVRAHIEVMSRILDDEAEVDPEWYYLLMSDLDILSDLLHSKEGYREFTSEVHSVLRKTLLSRNKALKFYDNVYDQIEAIHDYFTLLEQTAYEIQSEQLAQEIENL